MLPSLARLSLHAAPVAMDPPEPPRQKPRSGGSEERQPLPDLPPEIYVSIVANMMRGAPNKACEDLYNLCVTGKLPCGLMDSQVQREQVFKAACVHLFGVDDDAAVIAAQSPWGTFRNWQHLFGMLCFGFSSNGYEAMQTLWATLGGQMVNAVPNPYYAPGAVPFEPYGGAARGSPTSVRRTPSQWSDVHTILLNHRPESLPVVVRRATARMLDDVLIRFLHAYGMSTATWLSTMRAAQGPFVMDVYHIMRDQLLSMRYATPAAAVCWLLVNRGARLQRMIEQPYWSGGTTTVVVPGMTPTPRYYEIVDHELRQRITNGEDSDLAETIAEITRLRALGAVFDGLDESATAVSQRGTSTFLVLLGFFDGRIRYRLLDWLFRQEDGIRDEVYPPFGAVVRLAMMLDRGELTGGGPSYKVWLELLKAVYENRDTAFRQSIQLRSIFFQLLGHIPIVREFLGPKGPLGDTTETLWDELTDTNAIASEDDIDDITDYVSVEVVQRYGGGDDGESNYEVRSAREWMRTFRDRPSTPRPSTPRPAPPAWLGPNRFWSPEQNRWTTKVLVSDSDESEEELLGEDEYDDMADDDDEVGARDPTAPV